MLPTTAQEMQQRRWKQADIIIVTGDAYVDHPSFGVALIGRWLEKLGYRVAVLAQPDWQSVDAFRSLGPPRLFWAITSGAIDSRLNDYASMGGRRKKDVYSPGGKLGLRPRSPLLVYSARVREAYKGIPIIIGGLEASLRRFVHYDYIENKLKRSVLIDSKADLLVHSMGERAIKEIASRIAAGQTINDLVNIPGTAYLLRKNVTAPADALVLPSLAEQNNDPTLAMAAHKTFEAQAHPNGRPLIQNQDPCTIVIMPPSEPLTTEEMDALYALPFTRCYHSKYEKLGGVPALEPIRFSITTHRGCFGGCSFCSIHLHQGKHISSRSIESILTEAQSFIEDKAFRGTISDIGGPTANMYGMGCASANTCPNTSCLAPSVCKNLKPDFTPLKRLMRQLLKWREGQKSKINIFVASGVRYDLAMLDGEYIDLLVGCFTGGHLKVAPEHYCPNVLIMMNKPSFDSFEKFEAIFNKASQRAGKEQYLVSYFISAHPGCTADDALKLTEYLISRSLRPQQVQDFIPIPLTAATAMYVSGIDKNGKKIFIPKGHKEKLLQAALLQYCDPKNRKIVTDFLREKHRSDLIKKI